MYIYNKYVTLVLTSHLFQYVASQPRIGRCEGLHDGGDLWEDEDDADHDQEDREDLRG